MGSLFAIIAFLSWGIGDYLIQKTTRRFGDWLSLFYITASAAIILLPFVYKDVPSLFSLGSLGELRILILASIVSAVAALCLFEALRRGKIAVIDPIFAFEIVVTGFLAHFFLKEILSNFQIILIGVLVFGIILISIKSFSHFKNFKFESGVVFAILATLAMGGENFLNGLGARVTNPLMINWFVSLFVALITFLYLLYSGQFKFIIQDIKKRPALISWVCFTDNLGWIVYSFSMVYIPMALATGISEGYIALAVVLGLTLNKEKIKPHQIVGLIITVTTAMLLAFTS